MVECKVGGDLVYELLGRCPGSELALEVSELCLVQAQESPVSDVWNHAVRLKHTGGLCLPGLRFLRWNLNLAPTRIQ